jgi:hypothetical protein
MTEYEIPTITEVGSVADMTRGDRPAFAWDGFMSDHILGNTPTS